MNACASCGAGLEGELAPHLCEACGAPQPARQGEDYFSALGVPRRFAQDPEALQRKFYALSRRLHPDRFAAADEATRRASAQRMSLLNEAFNTLKDRALLRAYVLGLEGVQAADAAAGMKGALPADLAEAWFEIQDIVMEDPAKARTEVAGFEEGIGKQIEEEERELRDLEARHDQAPDRGLLQRIADGERSQGYLRSLRRDVGRLKSRLAGKGEGPGAVREGKA